MTVKEVQERVEMIRKMAVREIKTPSDSYPSSEEERLWADTLAAIASGHPDPQRLAAESLKTQEIEFDRM